MQTERIPMIKSKIRKIIQGRQREGRLEEANRGIRIYGRSCYYNCYTLRLYQHHSSSLKMSSLNAQIMKTVKLNATTYKEVREFQLLFRFFSRLQIHTGYLKKSETPDFLLQREGQMYGIEVTRIYTGNDWIAEKLHQEVEARRWNQKKLEQYIHEKKYDGKIRTFQTPKGIVVKAVKEKTLRKEEIIQIKNKLFEKIRKQNDDYQKFEHNYIFAEIVFAGYQEQAILETLNAEIRFVISHLDLVFGKEEYHLIVKIGNVWKDYDLKRGVVTSL